MPSRRTGPSLEIYADTTIPGTSAVAMTAFQANGNSVILEVTTTTGGCGIITFTAEESLDGGTTYGDMLDRDSVWSMPIATATTAGTYLVPMEGLPVVPGNWVRLSYTAATAAGKIQVKATNYDDPGGGSNISVGDLYADMTTVNALLTSIDGKTPALGTALMAASSPITIATDDTLTAAANALLTTVAGDTTSLDAKAPALGTAVMAASTPTTIATDDTQFGAVGVAAAVDGSLHAQMRSVAVAVEALATASAAVAPTVTNATGVGAISTTTAVAANWKLSHVSIHFSGPVVAAESVTVSLDANDGAAYDVPLDIALLTGLTDYIWYPEKDLLLESGDEISVAMTGSDGLTYGLRVVGETV